MSAKITSKLYVLAAAVLFLAPSLASQTRRPEGLITAPRVLANVADLLQQAHGKVVTYEDPVWLWRGELEGRNGRTVWLFPKSRVFNLPAGFHESLDIAAAAGSAVQSYNDQTDGSRFQLLVSPYGVHIVPAQSRDENGDLTNKGSVLDTVVTIPEAGRTPMEHLGSICAAVTAAAGIEVKCNASGIRPWLNRVFAATPSSFTWGASGLGARDALIALFQKSATSLTWRFFCQGAAKIEDRSCVLSILPIEVTAVDADGRETTVPVTYDRCPNCRPASFVPPQPMRGVQ
jgi:hypothetical protein